MRPSDPRQQTTSRPNLMSGNRKRSGVAGILDQLEPRPRCKPQAGFSVGIEPRWVWAGGGAIVLLVGALASIAWSTTTTAKALAAVPPPAQVSAMPGPLPVFEAGPARVERVPAQSQKAAAVLLAKAAPQAMPPPMPLVVLPRETVPKVERAPSARKSTPARAGKPPGQRHAVRRAAPKRLQPAPVPQAEQEADPDVALIRAIRKATQPPSE